MSTDAWQTHTDADAAVLKPQRIRLRSALSAIVQVYEDRAKELIANGYDRVTEPRPGTRERPIHTL